MFAWNRCAALAVLLGASACSSDSSSGGDDNQVTLTVPTLVFPDDGASTNAGTLIFRGRLPTEGPATVWVDGQRADQLGGDWFIRLQLEPGTTDVTATWAPPNAAPRTFATITVRRSGFSDILAVTRTDNASERIALTEQGFVTLDLATDDEAVLALTEGRTFGASLVFDRARRRVLTTDAANIQLLAVHRTTGDLEVVTGSDGGRPVGSGPLLSSPVDVAKGTGPVAYLIDAGTQQLLHVDLIDGTRTLISDLGLTPARVAVDEPGNRAFVATLGELFEVDLTTGVVTLISGPSVGAGPTLSIDDFDWDADRSRILVANDLVDDDSLLAVNPATGNRTIVVTLQQTASSNTQIYRLDTPMDDLVAVSDIQTDLPDRGFRNVLWDVDLSNDTASTVWNDQIGTGDQLGIVRGITLDRGDAMLAVSEDERVVMVELATGDRTVIASPTIGSGPTVTYQHLAFEPARDLAFSATDDEVLSISTDTLERTLIAPPALPLNDVHDLVWSPDRQRLFAIDEGRDAVLSINPRTERVSVVSNGSNGSGAAFREPSQIAIDAAGEKLYVLDLEYLIDLTPALVEVIIRDDDPRRVGDRQIIASNETGAEFDEPGDLVDHPDGLLLFQKGNLFLFNRRTGARTALSLAADTEPLAGDCSLALDRGRDVLYVASPAVGRVYAVDLRTGGQSVVTR